MAASPLFLVPLTVSRTAGDKTRNETYRDWSAGLIGERVQKRACSLRPLGSLVEQRSRLLTRPEPQRRDLGAGRAPPQGGDPRS